MSRDGGQILSIAGAAQVTAKEKWLIFAYELQAVA